MTRLQPTRPQNNEYLPTLAQSTEIDASSLARSVRRPMLAGLALVILFVVVFGGWAATAPLAGGAIAPGIISPDGSRKTIQHLEGGIIGAILVRDGDRVQAGAPLLTLEDTRARASYEVLLRKYQGLTALRARLTAEQLGHDQIDFPPDLLKEQQDREVREILSVQRHVFETRRAALAVKKRVLQQRILQIQESINGTQAQYASTQKQRELVTREMQAKEYLYNKKLMRLTELLAVRRASADIEGEQGAYRSAIAESEQKIGETELELVALDAVRQDQIASQLDAVRGELAETKEQLAASEDMLRRTVIPTPVSGTVVNLRFKTRGGVIQPGEPILDIVPAEDDLLIDARISPTDIDVVHAGLPAQVHLSAYAQRTMPRIDGTVRSVSADSLSDDNKTSAYYLARVEVDRQQLADLGIDVELIPGMPAEVLIVTSERTLFGYLLQPFRDLFRRSLREV